MSRDNTQVLRINSQFSARPEGTLSQSEATERILNSQLESNTFFNVPNKRAEAEFLGRYVHCVEFLQDDVNLAVINHGDDARAHGGPGMIAVVRLSRLGTPALQLLHHGEAAAVVCSEQIYDTLSI